MSKAKLIYVFVLWSLMWISISLLGWYFFMDYMFKNYNLQFLNFNWQELLSSVKSWLKSVPVGWDNNKYVKFDNVWNTLKQQYFDQEKLKQQDMIEAWLKWYVEAIWDPYTVYMTTKENESFQSDLKWEKDFEWIWAVVWKKENGVSIDEVIKWSPAYKAWLKPLDLILEINWEKTKNMSVADAVSKIRGPKWTTVELTILRNLEKDITKITVTRDKIVIPSVMSKTYDITGGNTIWYVNISIIWEDTERALASQLKDFKQKNVKGIIIDLRWNWWWYLPIAVEIASHFVPKDKLVVSSKYRVYPSEDYKSKWYWDYEWTPVVVLVDGLSASASEIIAAALRDNIGAKIVWTKTFGKWSIQTMSQLSAGSSLKYTIGKWYTPKWENVDLKWLQPDIKIELDKKLYDEKQIDNQLEWSKDVLLKMIK